MGFLDLIFGKRDLGPMPRSMIGFPSDGGLTSGGVTATTTLGLSAVWRCIDILSNGVSQLEWRERRGTLDLPLSRIVARPQAQRTRREWTSLVVSTLALFDVCYLFKAGGEDSEGVPVGLWYLDPTIVSPASVDLFTSAFLLPPEEFFISNQRVPASDLVIMHRSPQPTISDTAGGIINLARTTFAAAIAAERYASRYWQSGGSPTTVLETEQRLLPNQIAETSELWAEKRSRGPDYAPVLSGGLKARSFGADPTSESAVEARRELVADIGRYFGIPTRILNAPTGDSETYSSTEAGNQDLVRYTLQNYIGAIEDAISDQLPGGRKMQMDTRRLTAGTQLAQAQAYQLATGNQPWMKPEEVRDDWALAPLEIPIVIPTTQPTPVDEPPQSLQDREAMAVMRDAVTAMAVRATTPHEPPVYNISTPVTIENGAIQATFEPPAPAEVNVTVPEQAAPVVNIEKGAVQVASPPPAEVIVNIPEPKPVTRKVKWDKERREATLTETT